MISLGIRVVVDDLFEVSRWRCVDKVETVMEKCLPVARKIST